MGLLYQDDLVIVKQTFFGSWRVVNRLSGATIAPEMFLQERVGLTWPRVRRFPGIDPNHRRFAEDVLMQTFALASLYPNGPMAEMLKETEPPELAAAMVIEAADRLQLLGIRQHPT